MSTIARATIKSYDATTHSATVQIAGSLAVWLDALPVSDGIAPADVVAGRECGVIFFTEDNPADAAIVTIHNAVPAGWPGTAARYSTVQDEGAPLTQRSTLNFAGAGVTATDSGGVTLVTIPGGGGAVSKIADADASTYVDTEQSADEDMVRMAVGTTLRYLLQGVSPNHTLTGDVYMTTTAAIGGTVPEVKTVLRLNDAADFARTGLIVDVGSIATGVATGSSLYGVRGNAVSADATGTIKTLAGLNFTAGINGATGTVTAIAGISVSLIALSSTATVTNTQFLTASFSTLSGPPVITTHTSLNLPGSSSTVFGTFYHIKGGSVSGAGVVYVPFEFAGPARTTDTDGSAHRNNIQFGSVTRSFGGGDGVIGLTFATTKPTANPTGGVVAYANSTTGNLEVRGTAGTICKLPTGGPTNVTGSRAANAALANLLTVLAGLGLIVDGTTV